MSTKYIGHRISIASLCVVLMLILSVMVPVAAQEAPLPLPSEGSNRNLSELQVDDIVKSSVTYADGRVSVIVRLADAPGVRSTRDAVLQAQNTFAAQASVLGARLENRTYFLTNTVTLAVDPANIAELSRMPGVVGVYPNEIVERADTVSVPRIGADAVWTGTGTTPSVGYTGAGTVIAILDSGIDYTHVHFGGDGDYNADNTTFGDTGNPFGAFPIVAAGDQKVVGGWDFVGDAYDASTPAVADPVPDEDPIDCVIEDGGGHGTHVAGSAAGWGVTSAGATYAGPFDDTIFTSFPSWTNAFRIGPGVAPEAALLAMKIFGCDGSTSIASIIAAIEASVSGEVIDINDFDGDMNTTEVVATFTPANVINMSLGSGFGTSSPDYPYNVTIANATEADVIVVASAGNSGYTQYITGSPAAADSAISVANTLDGGNQARGVRDDATTTIYPASYGASSPFIHPPLTAVSIVAQPLRACEALTNAADVDGKIVLIERGDCPFSDKQDNAFEAGAVGVIVFNNAGNDLINMAAATAAGYDLPTVFVGQTNGAALVASVDGTNTITMDPALGAFVTEAVDTASGSTSRGPARDSQGSFKPDIAAPGTTILSAGSGTGDLGYNISGTSMAAPHVAGVMALLVEKYPGWSSDQLKALVMNTANQDVTNGTDTFGPQSVGAGRVVVTDTFNNEVIAYNALNPDGVSVSFGFPNTGTSTFTDTRDITVQNLGSAAVTYDVTVDTRSDANGVSFSVSPAQITVAANATETVTVTLTVNTVAAANANGDPTFSAAGHRFVEESGLVILAPADGVSLRVPVYAAPQINSALTASVETLNYGALQQENTVTFTGTPLDTSGAGTGGDDLVSIATMFELVAESPNDPAIPDHFDVRYVGITSDYPDADPTEFAFPPDGGYVYFAIVTYAEWDAPNGVFFTLQVDTDSDGTPDHGFYNTTSGGSQNFQVGYIDYTNFFGFGAGALVSGFNVPLNMVSFNIFNTYLYHNHIMIFPIPMEWFVENRDGFDFWVTTEDNRIDGVMDTVGSSSMPFSYNPAVPAYDFGNIALDPAVTSTAPPAFAITATGTEIDFSSTASGVSELPDILVLHHHNDPGSTTAPTAQVFDVNFDTSVLFNLLGPADGTAVTSAADLASVNTITWEVSTGATEYEFVLDRPGDLPQISLPNLTPDGTDTDGLSCDTTTCTLTLTDGLDSVVDGIGEYVWNVFATNASGVQPANEAFSFFVVSFSLVSPADGTYFLNTADIAAVTWEPSPGAETYTFTLFQLSNNTRIGVVLPLSGLTPSPNDAPGDPLACTATLCTLTVAPEVSSTLTSGQYAWTVEAVVGTSEIEAANAPFFFTLDTGEVEVLENNSFDENTDGILRTPDGWRQSNQSRDRVRCDATLANSGDCYYEFRPSATEDSRLVQDADLTGLGAGDTLDFSAFVNGPATTAVRIRVVVTYEDLTRERTRLTILADDAGTNVDGYDEYTGSILLEDTPRRIKVQIQNRTTAGRVYVDDVTLTLNRNPAP